MTGTGRTRRSAESVTDADLARLAELGAEHHTRFQAAHPAWAQELLATCLAQGAAAHRVEGTRGVKDLDICLFYALPAGRSALHPWNRHVLHVDFGPSHHGRSSTPTTYGPTPPTTSPPGSGSRAAAST